MGFFAKIKAIITASTVSKIVTAAIVAAVVGAGTVGLSYAGVFTGAETALGMAVMNTFTGQSSTVEEVFGIKTLAEAALLQGTECSAAVSVDELSLDELGLSGMTLPKTGIRLVTKSTPAEEVNAVLDVTMANTAVISGNIYADKNRLQVNIPKLFEQVLTLNYGNADIEAQMKASYAADYLGFTDEQIEELVEVLPKQTETASEEELRKAILDILVSNYELKLAETELEKGGKEELQENGQTRKCKVYVVEMEGQDLGEFIDLTHYEIQNYLMESAEKYNLTPEQVEEVFGMTGAWVSQLKNWMRGPVLVKCYVFEKRVIKFSVDWTMETVTEAGPGTAPGTLTVNFAPEGNPMENMTLELHTPLHQDITVTNVPQQLDVVYRAATENSEERYGVTYYAEYNSMPATAAFEYEKLNGDYTLEVTVKEHSVALQGVVDRLENGSSIGFTVDTFRYEGEENLVEQELEVDFFVKLLDTEVAPLTGTARDVLVMTEADFKQLENEISQNITWMLFSLMGLFQ